LTRTVKTEDHPTAVNPTVRRLLETYSWTVIFNLFCRKLNGYKYGGVFKVRQPVLLIRDPEIIKSVLVKEFNSFHDNDIESVPDVDPVFGRNPFVLTGER
jgi:hypothetical protein